MIKTADILKKAKALSAAAAGVSAAVIFSFFMALIFRSKSKKN